MKVSVEISDQRISDLLCSALEGGSNYWYMITAQKKPPSIKFHAMPESPEKVFPHLDYPMNAGGSITIKSLEEPEKRAVILTKQKLERGLQLMAEKHPQHWADFLAENDDATTGDVFLQLACYGEVIYG